MSRTPEIKKSFVKLKISFQEMYVPKLVHLINVSEKCSTRWYRRDQFDKGNIVKNEQFHQCPDQRLSKSTTRQEKKTKLDSKQKFIYIFCNF